MKKRWEMGEHKLNEMGEWKELDNSERSSKSKTSPYSPVVFKQDCSLETNLELWTKKAVSEHLYFSKHFKIVLICIWILKSDYWFFCWILLLVIQKSENESHTVVSDFAIPWAVAQRVLCPRDSPSKNTGVGCHFLLQGIFPTQGLNPGLLHCRQILYQLSY